MPSCPRSEAMNKGKHEFRSPCERSKSNKTYILILSKHVYFHARTQISQTPNRAIDALEFFIKSSVYCASFRINAQRKQVFIVIALGSSCNYSRDIVKLMNSYQSKDKLVAKIIINTQCRLNELRLTEIGFYCVRIRFVLQLFWRYCPAHKL